MGVMQVTEAARKHSGTASQKVQDAKDYAADTAQAGSDYVKDTQQQGESAWQKVKDRVTETVDKVLLLISLRCPSRFTLSVHVESFLDSIEKCTQLHPIPEWLVCLWVCMLMLCICPQPAFHETY